MGNDTTISLVSQAVLWYADLDSEKQDMVILEAYCKEHNIKIE